MKSQRDWLTQNIAEQFAAQPEFLWQKYPNYAVFRHSSNRKWFAIVMNVSVNDAPIDIVNVKLPPEWIEQLSGQDGFLPAYHMNKKHWLSVKLNGSLPQTQIWDLVKTSFQLTHAK